MIKLAANWSTALEKLLRKINPPLDYLKMPLEREARLTLNVARALRPVLLHGWGGFYRAGMLEIPQPGVLLDLVQASSTPYISVHLDVQPEDFETPITRELALERVVKSVSALKKLTGLEVLLENVAHYAWSERPSFVTDPSFIAECLERSNTGFLLDLAHARVSAYHRGEEARDYLGALPLDKVKEIHVSGARLEADGLRDRHLPLSELDYLLLEEVIAKTPNLNILTLEYGGISDMGKTSDGREIRIPRNDSSALLEQLGRLDTLRKRASGVLRTAPTLPAGWHLDKRLNMPPAEELSQGSIRALGY
jgi:uncharacterized protein